MSDLFLPFQESSELQKMGVHMKKLFAIYYTMNGKDWVQTDMHSFEMIDDSINFGPNHTVGALLYDQVFTWFREKGFLIDLTSHSKDEHEFYIKYPLDKSILSNIYSTYDEMKLECVRALIKILKKINETNT